MQLDKLGFEKTHVLKVENGTAGGRLSPIP